MPSVLRRGLAEERSWRKKYWAWFHGKEEEDDDENDKVRDRVGRIGHQHDPRSLVLVSVDVAPLALDPDADEKALDAFDNPNYASNADFHIGSKVNCTEPEGASPLPHCSWPVFFWCSSPISLLHQPPVNLISHNHHNSPPRSLQNLNHETC